MNEISSIVIPIILSAACAALGWLYRQEKEKRVFIERQLSEKKYQTYTLLMELFFSVVKDTKENKKFDEKEMLNKMWQLNRDMIIYASDTVLKRYQLWMYNSRNNTDTKEMFDGLFDIMVSIRKDMGHSNTSISNTDILKQILTDYDDAKQKGFVN